MSRFWTATRRRGPALAVSLACLLPREVGAVEGDAPAAEALFREGKRLLELRDYEAACPKLAESYRLDPATGALLATALCYEQAGKLASAWVAYTDAAARAKLEGNDARERSAGARAAELEPRLPRLIVVAPAQAEPELVVLRDGIRIGEAAWGTPMPLDPGERWIEARAPGKQPFRTRVTAIEGQELRVEIPALAEITPETPPVAAPTAAASVTGAARASATTAEANPPPGFWTPLRRAGAVVGGAGLIALGVGVAFGTRALSLKESSSSDCDANSVCGPRGYDDRMDARNAATIAGYSGLAGLGLGVVSLSLLVLGAPDAPETLTLQLRPSGSGGWGGTLQGSF